MKEMKIMRIRKRDADWPLTFDEIESEVFNEVTPQESDLKSDNSWKKVIRVKFFFLHLEYGKNDGDLTPCNLRVVSEQSSSEMVELKNGYHLNIFHVNIDTVFIDLQHCTCGKKGCRIENKFSFTVRWKRFWNISRL